MKNFKISVAFAALLTLSQQAQGADAPTAKGPLTPAEKAQCHAQVTELNQGVKPYNERLGEFKALGTEIEALRAELDKEQAAVDRNDSAAMQALNAKIGRNNELVERHEAMGLSIKAVASERKQRAADFREMCENRPAAPPPSPTQPPESACSAPGAAKGIERQLEASFVTIRADEKQHQAEVERVAKARAKEQSWSEDKRGKVFLQMLMSPKFMAFERQKQPYVKELMSVMGAQAKNGQEECKLLQRIAATLPAIKAINARQYAFMADEIRAAK